MQSVLSIDATIEPAVVAVTRIVGEGLEVVESHRVSLTHGLKPSPPPPPQPEGSAPPSDGAAPAEVTAQPKLDLTSMVKTPWTSAVVIIPGEHYHSLNLDLPFNDPRKLGKIIDLEVQDLVPFAVDEFIVQHKTVSPNKDGTFDVHVSIMPREHLAAVLAACKEGGVEPAVVSTATSVVAALPRLYPSFPRDTVVVLHRAPAYYITFMLDGEVRTDRIIHTSILNGNADPADAALNEIKLSIAAVEQKYGRVFERVFLLDTPFTATEATQALGHPASLLALPTISGPAGAGSEIAAVGAVFVRDREPIQPLTNFRTREFAYNLQLTELWRGLRVLRPYFLATFAAVAVSLGIIYFLREQRIVRLEQAKREQILAMVPDLQAPEGRESDALQGQINALDRQLKDLGSPVQISPLDALLNLSRDIAPTSGINVSRVTIKGNKVTIDASAPNYAAAEALKSALGKKRSIYCRVRMESSSVAGSESSRGFRFEVFLCD